MKKYSDFFLLLIGCGTVLSATQCCTNLQLMRTADYCGNDTRKISLNCTKEQILLKNVIVNNSKISVQDPPSVIYAEDPNEFCVGEMYKNASQPEAGKMSVAVICVQETTQDDYIKITGALTLTSALFLLATIAVYLYLPQMRDLQGMCYTCMCLSMALGFLYLGILQVSPGFIGESCTVTGFLIYFWMMATFFWMNVICVNVYLTVKNSSFITKTERKQYYFYSCYAWGGTLFFLMVTIIANYTEGDHWKPNIGTSSCWIAGRTETWIFFYGPIAILITSNVTMFIFSSYNLWQHTKNYEVNKLKYLKHKFLLSLKLFLVMGVSWIFEIASFAHGENHIIWKILDTFNCLQGVVIFILLVILRRRAIQGLANKNCCLPVTHPLAKKLSPHDDYDQHILSDDSMEIRLN